MFIHLQTLTEFLELKSTSILQIRVSFITNRSNPATNSQDQFEFQRFSDSIGNHHHRISVSFLQFEPQGDHKKEFEREEKKTDRIRNWIRGEEDRRNQHRITAKSETLGFQIKNRSINVKTQRKEADQESNGSQKSKEEEHSKKFILSFVQVPNLPSRPFFVFSFANHVSLSHIHAVSSQINVDRRF
jgi:preprotein translocase subunit SecD